MTSFLRRHLVNIALCAAAAGACTPGPLQKPTLTQSLSIPTLTLSAPRPSQPIPTPTLAKAITLDEALPALTRLFSPSQSCVLPCLWGITPGITTDQEALRTLTPLSSIGFIQPASDPLRGGIYIAALDGHRQFDFLLSYWLSPDRHVRMVTLGTMAGEWTERGVIEPLYEEPTYQDLLAPYLLAAALSSFGTPDQVFVDVFVPGEAPTIGKMTIWLTYTRVGLILEYNSDASLEGESLVSCPTDSFVRISTLSKNTPEEAFHEAIGDHLPLTEATGKFVSQFVHAFKSGSDQCLSTLWSVWPYWSKRPW